MGWGQKRDMLFAILSEKVKEMQTAPKRETTTKANGCCRNDNKVPRVLELDGNINGFKLDPDVR